MAAIQEGARLKVHPGLQVGADRASSLSMKRILVALDGSERAPAVLAKAVELAVAMGASLRLLRAVELPPVLPSSVLMGEHMKAVDHAFADARCELEEMARRVQPGLVQCVDVIAGAPWDAICATAREHDVDLVVIGAHGYRIMERLLGTTASKVVNHLDRAVYVVREIPERAVTAAVA
jgi:nucleotide-binding universal stress UspA family protein